MPDDRQVYDDSTRDRDRVARGRTSVSCAAGHYLADVPWRSNNKTISASTRAGVAWFDGLIGLEA
jgi:hypothetical protein